MLSNALVFGAIGMAGIMGGIIMIGLGQLAEGIPPILIGALFLWRSRGEFGRWTDG